MTAFLQKYEGYRARFERELKAYCENMTYEPDVLKESMRYSLLLSGKRIRPVLLLATAEMLGVKEEDVMPFALSIEMIHTYSLIHDDLPAMDNDDFRRGMPSNHKVFGEANAILAGDALLNEGLTLAIGQALKGRSFAQAALFLSECAGAGGMIAGQSEDLLCSKSDSFSERELSFVDSHKTGKLLLAPIVIPAILCDYDDIDTLKAFGEKLGKLFQWTDDILDEEGSFEKMGKTLGKDKNDKKLTCVSLFGLQGAKERADECKEECLSLLSSLKSDASFLREMVVFVRERNH